MTTGLASVINAADEYRRSFALLGESTDAASATEERREEEEVEDEEDEDVEDEEEDELE